ncbi:MAG TPA: hypothetical protein VJJ26_02040 [Candidatus Babeliales bacterium]|nr:hypothetical protein [Candidatus Babeliales bacterium]
MKKHRDNGYVNIMLMNFFILCSTSSVLKAYQVNLSFDSLFPMTWYQKGLEASLQVWHELADVFNKNGDDTLISCDLLLGKLAFAQFCVNRMIYEGNAHVSEDIAYFITVLHTLQRLLAMVVITPKTQDFVVCAGEMVVSIQKLLSSL